MRRPELEAEIAASMLGWRNVQPDSHGGFLGLPPKYTPPANASPAIAAGWRPPGYATISDVWGLLGVLRDNGHIRIVKMFGHWLAANAAMQVQFEEFDVSLLWLRELVRIWRLVSDTSKKDIEDQRRRQLYSPQPVRGAMSAAEYESLWLGWEDDG
jgi:hypothetical protein